MTEDRELFDIGIVGAGTMGRGIAQIAADAGHMVYLFDADKSQIDSSLQFLASIYARLVEKGKINEHDATSALQRITGCGSVKDLADCGLVIEAVVEDLNVKRSVLASLEESVLPTCIIGTNTSSLSVTSLAAGCAVPSRVVGIHFFNPAPLLPLVEVVPAIDSDLTMVANVAKLMSDWGKSPVIARDTPGFIVNRVARPFYGEALRILDEGIADIQSIDRAMTEEGGFRMGPFELMDLIGNDVNYKVTESIFHSFFGEPRYKPSFTQKRMVESGRLGRKSGQGYYKYDGKNKILDRNPESDIATRKRIVDRIVTMLINEAIDALFWGVATAEDIDTAMTKGVNYPQGLLRWADEIGLPEVYSRMRALYDHYCEERYRPSPLLKQMVESGSSFYG